MTHRGRPGDSDAALVTLRVLFEEKAGDPLTTAIVEALMARGVLVLTADSTPESVLNAIRDRAYTYLTKPVTAEALLPAVAHALSSSSDCAGPRGSTPA